MKLCAQNFKNYILIFESLVPKDFNTVNRIAAPTKPSSKGDSKLCGSPLATYRKREWLYTTREKPSRYGIHVCIDLA